MSEMAKMLKKPNSMDSVHLTELFSWSPSIYIAHTATLTDSHRQVKFSIRHQANRGIRGSLILRGAQRLHTETNDMQIFRRRLEQEMQPLLPQCLTRQLFYLQTGSF